ncbi:type II secretion system inner membrane protein GspF [Crenobacter cavernae]|uniref:General secretion pathway protein F n=1 Tax=Crenobacter cavernae TaxID=2290923 RepID=A0A345Y9H3_9NEIS|nr:type II secretion system inner membrane protein GspF [Crenobacter cavernae]AXK40575.1 type II secretion system protein GspF [Crenobacter cavernae]
MAAFRYQAYLPDGSVKEGVIEADSARAARARLREEGLLPSNVEEIASKSRRRKRLPGVLLAMLTRQLATLLSAGLPLERALAALIEQAEEPASRELLSSLRSRVLEGMSLSSALAEAPHAFSPLYVAMVAAGEASGRLDEVLERLSQHLETRQDLQQKVVFALAYPAVVTLVAIGVVAALMAYVVPQVAEVFTQTRQTLPLLTRLLMAASGFLREWGIVCLIAIAGVAIGFARLMKIPAWRERVEVRLLRLPLVGRLLTAVNTARLAGTLSILVGSGVPLLTALETAKSLMNLAPLKQAVSDAMARLREGSTLSRSLAETKLFPPVLVQLVQSGEASGSLATMLDRAAREQAQQVERRLAALTTLFEPLLILGMGAVVLIIVLAIMLPIIDMNQMVR